MNQHPTPLHCDAARRVRCAPARVPRLSLLLALAGLLTVAPWLAPPASAHPGALDEFGGHFDDNGQYHYHKPPRDMGVRKQEVLEWTRFPVQGSVHGVVESVDEHLSLWLYVAYRPAYQELVQQVAVGNRDDRKQTLRVDLAHVSPQETAARSPRFAKVFTQKVAHDLKQKVLGKEVTVNFSVVGGAAGRLRGMVFQGEDNLNLWMVLNGLSYYVMDDRENPFDALFRQAEDVAKRDKAGIWQHIR